MLETLCPIRDVAKKDPTKIAIFSDKKNTTYLELDQMISEMQCRIDEPLHSKVILHQETNLDLICKVFACLRNQLSICILDPKLPDEKVLEIQKQLYAKKLNLRSKYKTRSVALLDYHYPAIFLRTSGSSGESKLAALTLYAITSNLENALKLDPSDRWNLSLSMHHIAGLSIAFRSFYNQAAIILSDDPFKYDPTHLSWVPTQLYRYIDQEFPSSLKMILIGGAPLSTSLLQKANEKELPLVLSYSMTENCSVILLSENPIVYQNKIYLGFPKSPQKMKISDEEEICIQGPSLFSGYWRNHQVEKKLVNGWFKTKDLGHCHPQFGYTITGRKDRQFISGGENIQPEEIEKVLNNHPKIRAAFVLPKEDSEYGFVPVAIIDGEVDLEIKKYLSKHLPNFKHPKVFIRETNLPKKPSVSILKSILEIFFLKKINVK